MKIRICGVGLSLLLMVACSGNNFSYENPNLLNVNVNFMVNLSLPQYNSLQFPLNPVYVSGYGNGGVIIINAGGGNYLAFDAADPNHPVQECSVLKIDGIEGQCQCDDHNTYNLVSGTVIDRKSGGEDFSYTMKPYQVVERGNGVLVVRN